MQIRLALFLMLASTEAQQVVSSGTAEIPGTYNFSFDRGVLVSADLVLAKPHRVLMPYLRASAAYLGKVDFEDLTPEALSAYSYRQGRLDATDSSVVITGTVIAVRTNHGNLAKAVIKAVPEPGQSGPLVLDWVAYRASNGEVLTSGSIGLTPGMEFSFDAGAPVDVFWNQWTHTTRALVSHPPAKLANIGVQDFDALFASDIKKLLAKAPNERIGGNDDNNALVPGDVFVVQTGAGNYAKAVVTAPFDPAKNHGLIFRWVTYAGQ